MSSADNTRRLFLRIGPLLPFLSASLCLCVAPQVSRADSIWNRANGGARALYADDTARGVGDNLTIIINEQTKIDNSSERKLEKSNSATATGSGSADTGNVLNPTFNKILSALKFQTSLDGQSKFDGKSDYGDSRSLVDQITVTVEDVLPNGNLVVVGKREREVGGDKQIIAASGVVRPSDISFANTISSEKVANFQITVRNKGQDKQATNPGWLSRFLNWINPF
jgi:flagellar L-ring protein precursor FlgH